MLKKGKILIELGVLFLLVAFVAELVLAYISYKTAEENLQAEITNSLHAIASRQIEQFNEEIERQTLHAEALALVPTVVESFTRQSDQIIAKDLFFFQKAFGFTELYLFRPNAELLYSSEKGTIGKSKELMKIFNRTNTLLQTEISDFMFLQNQAWAWVATPVFQKEKLIGILVAEFDNKHFLEVCENHIGLGQTGQTSLWVRNAENIVLMNPRRNKPQTIFWKIPFDKVPSYLQKALKGEFGRGLVSNVEQIENLAFWSYVPALRGAIVVQIEKQEVFAPIDRLRSRLTIVAVLTLLVVLVAAWALAQHFSRPIVKLTNFAREVAKGNLALRVEIEHKNEIGILADTFNEMTAHLEQKTNELANYNAHLEEKIEERTETIQQQNRDIQEQLAELQATTEEMQQQTEEILAQRDALEEASIQLKRFNQEIGKKNQDITDSINYAKRIQTGLLPPNASFERSFEQYFVLYQPRDIVSGDFYWIHRDEEATVVIVADCTGHGVPGAMMSMIGIQILNKLVVNFGIIMPEDILQELHNDMVKIIQTKGSNHADAMDISICTIFPDKKEFLFGGALQTLYYVQKGELQQIKGDKNPIGSLRSESVYQTHRVKYGEEPTWVYLCTDGYADQFGGKLDRRLMTKRLRELLLEIKDWEAEKQKEHLLDYFENWRGKQAQIDDVTLLGFLI